jgi:transglutaminase-like putative cysteine protease
LIPTDGEVLEIAQQITNKHQGILKKSRAIYDWMVVNTTRDPSVKGCGLGIVELTLVKRSGKCADLSTVYVAIARASGVPAREVFGLRLGNKTKQDITGDYHCWAEFYLPGTGWVPVDPADVRKIMFAKGIDLEEAVPYQEYYFGSVDENRIALKNGGRGIQLIPPAKRRAG